MDIDQLPSTCSGNQGVVTSRVFGLLVIEVSRYSYCSECYYRMKDNDWTKSLPQLNFIASQT